MEDINIVDAAERYLRGEMSADETAQFENLRKANAEVDQFVVSHHLFLQQMNNLADTKAFKATLHTVHTELTEGGKIESMSLRGKAKLVYLWNRYKRVTAIAASIAGITALSISALVWAFTPKHNSNFAELNREINKIKNTTVKQGEELKEVKKEINRRDNTKIEYKSGGTGFIIDAKGYLVTNYHVVAGAKHIAIQNKKGEFIASIVFVDKAKDIAILKIEDDNFKPYVSIPYSISKNSAKLAEPIFTLGYPKDDIVYGQGYLSSLTGFESDTLSCQIEISANHGNSGSPILNKNGEVVGIINGRQVNVEGFTFAIQGKYIYKALDELKKADTSYNKIKLNAKSSLTGMDRTAQVSKVEDYIYMVKVN
jgi:serine protease Do